MPRKTRKQKQKAEERRRAQRPFQAQNEGLVKGEFEFDPKRFSQARKPKKSVKKVDKSILLYKPRLAVRDLLKTLLIALGVFSLEIMVYLIWFRM